MNDSSAGQAASYLIFYTNGDGSINLKMSYSDEQSLMNLIYTIFDPCGDREVFAKMLSAIRADKDSSESFRDGLTNMLTHFSNQLSSLNSNDEPVMLPSNFS